MILDSFENEINSIKLLQNWANVEFYNHSNHTSQLGSPLAALCREVGTISSALEHAAVGEARGLLLRGKLLLGIHLPQLGGTLRRVAENDLEERLELGKIELPAVIVVAHSKQLRNLLVTRRS